MKRIGITQRVSEAPGYDERRDCLDQRWCALLEGLGLLLLPIPNRLSDPASHFLDGGFEGFILSSGNDLAHLPDPSGPAPERDRTELVLLEFAASEGLPVLGVCRGLQVMNHYCGGWLVPVEGHVVLRHAVRAVPGSLLFSEYDEVNSFHNWALPADGVGPPLIAEAYAGDGTVEAVRHPWLAWLGIMWHPEREVPASGPDMRLIRALFDV